MTPGEIVAIIVAVGGFITAIYTQRNSATRESAIQRNAEIDAQFKRLSEENAAQAKALIEVRAENTRMFGELTDMRRELRAKDDEIFNLKRDLATEKIRADGLEIKVNVLTAERDAALDKANNNGSRPKTGPLSS